MPRLRHVLLVLTTLSLALLALGAAPPEPSAWEFLSNTTIGARAFIEAHPSWDGRGVVIAVIDTGVDPGLAGLQSTPAGAKKILDLRDFSGEGDITLVTAKFDEDAHGPGIHDGDGGPWLRGADKLAPAPDEGTLKIGALREAKLQNSEVADLDGSGAADGVFGAVVYEAGGKRHVVVDTDGDLADETVRGDYADVPEVFVLGAAGRRDEAAAITLALNLWEERPDTLTFVFDDGAHGSHVAGIATGHAIGGQAGQHGIAPGANLISLKLGNNTLSGGASTPGSMWNAWHYAAKWAEKHDVPVVVQMSYGIGSEAEGRAKVEAEIDRLLGADERLVGCVSNGNEGPGLSTAGLPSCARRVIATGAALNRETAAHLYGETLPQHDVFYFSSRGAEMFKPDILAPGVAASTVPHWSGSDDVMRGTSMASPQAAGAAALVLSAAKAEGLPIVGAWVREAFRRSAKPLPNLSVLDQGPGMLDVAGAWAAYRELASREGLEPLSYAIETVSPDAPGMEGPAAHWRGVVPPAPPAKQAVTVTTEFRANATADEKQNFYRGYDLESDAAWVQVAERSTYTRGGNPFTIHLSYDPAKLQAPGLYTARVRAWDKELSRKERATLGPDWEMPVSVVVPHAPAPGEKLTLATPAIRRGAVHRVFVRVPVGATGFEILAENTGEQVVRVYLHDPEGRRNWLGRIGGTRGSKLKERLAAHALDPGVYEIDVYADYENSAAAEAKLSLRFDALALEASKLSLAAREGAPPTGTLALMSRSAATLNATLDAKIVGYVADSTEKGGKRLTRPLKLAPELASVDLELETCEGQWKRVTDVAVRVLDDNDKALLSDGMGYRILHSHFERPGSGLFEGTLEVLPGYGDPGDDAPFRVHVTRRYHLASPIALKLDDTRVAFYPDRVTKVDFEAAATPIQLPKGARWLVEVTVRDRKDDTHAATLLLEATP